MDPNCLALEDFRQCRLSSRPATENATITPVVLGIRLATGHSGSWQTNDRKSSSISERR